MKTKKYILGLSILTVTSLIIFAFTPYENESSTIMIRSTQLRIGGSNESLIRIYSGNQQVERIELDKWKYEEGEKNYDLIISTVKDYESKGYEIISHTELLIGTNGIVITFLLTKK